MSIFPDRMARSSGRLIAALGFSVVLSSVRASTPSHAWPQFRGPDGSGVAAGALPPTQFGPTEQVVWSVEVPFSPSSPCIWDDRIFLTTFSDGQLETRCHDRADGRLRGTSVLVECDGLGKYDEPGASVREKLREDEIRTLGWEVVRVTTSLLDEPLTLARRVKDAIDRARSKARRPS